MQQFTAVGYGGQEAVTDPGRPASGYPDTGEYVVSRFNAVCPSYLRNTNSRKFAYSILNMISL